MDTCLGAVHRQARFLIGELFHGLHTPLPLLLVTRKLDPNSRPKGLCRVERTFREEKSTFEVRPIYHHRDETCIGHIVASFLALRLQVDLQLRLEPKGIPTSWPDLMKDIR